MNERKRLENAEIKAFTPKGMYVLVNGNEAFYQFSKFNPGLKRGELKVGDRIDADVYKDAFLSNVSKAASDLTTAPKEPPKKTVPPPAQKTEEFDTVANRIIRGQVVRAAAEVLATYAEPVSLDKLFEYSRLIELACHRGFDAGIEEYDRWLEASESAPRLAA